MVSATLLVGHLDRTPATTTIRYLRSTGWLGELGWQVGVAFPAFLGAGQLQAPAVLKYPEHSPQRWHVTLTMIAILQVCVFFTTFLAQKLHLVEGVIMVLHIAGFFGILITLWVTSTKASSKKVWTSFYDPGWGSQGLSGLIGLVASVALMLGADASGMDGSVRPQRKLWAETNVAHMAEELQDAAWVFRGPSCGQWLLMELLPSYSPSRCAIASATLTPVSKRSALSITEV